MKIIHVTSVHRRYDTRIFLKYSKSCYNIFNNLTLIVCDGLNNEKRNGVDIIDLGLPKNRIHRILLFPLKIFKRCLKLNADIYHFHDPELMYVAFLLKIFGKNVVFDIHEDASSQLMDKSYINYFLKPVLKNIILFSEIICYPFMSGLITATPFLLNKYKKYNKNTIGIYNYLLLDELIKLPKNINLKYKKKNIFICYIGGIDKIRGIKNIIKSLSYSTSKVRLCLAGNYVDSNFRDELKKLKEWKLVDEFGVVNRKEMKNIFNKSLIGLVTFLPAKNHINALPNKIFEYMGGGTFVLGSDFPDWKHLIEKNNIGYCVDPTNPKMIAKKIDFIIKNKKIVEKKIINANKLIKEKFNWEIQLPKLKSFYLSLVN